MKSQATEFLKAFQLRSPVIQSPMAGHSTVQLAATVTSLGGLGSLPFSGHVTNTELIKSDLDSFQSLIKDEQLKRTVNVNFFANDPPVLSTDKNIGWLNKYKAIYESVNAPWTDINLNKVYPSFKQVTEESHPVLKLLSEAKPKIVSFHFGIPQSKIIKFLQSFGIKVFAGATNLAEFKEVVSEGVDGVILQGYGAGGHRGNFIANDLNDDKLSTQDLVKTVVQYIDSRESLKVPFLIAAGGIFDSEGANKLLAYGIAAVQLGTIWLPTNQATISEAHLQLFKNPQGRRTISTAALSGRTLRTIESDFLNELNKSELSEIPDYPIPYELLKRLKTEIKLDRFLPFLSGENFHKSWKGTDDATKVFEQIVDGLNYD